MTVDNAHLVGIGEHGERAPHVGVGDGIIIQIETDIRRLAGGDGHPLEQRVGVVRQLQQKGRLGRPILLTGDPGRGKTLAAYWIASRLKLMDNDMFEFHVKSDSRAKDLCYQFDAVSWYRESQLSAVREDIKAVSKEPYLSPGPLGKAFGWRGAEPTTPCVVLIDEIDKAPRDFPNDLLLELDQMQFTITETNTQIVCPSEARPIIVITSNAERRLPVPFLRRCIIHHIVLDESVVPKILASRLAEFEPLDTEILLAASEFWLGLASKNLSRKPTIDEFWRWLALVTLYGGQAPTELVSTLRQSGDSVHRLPFISMLFADEDLVRAIGRKSS
jgi:MoxR-like ATPase